MNPFNPWANAVNLYAQESEVEIVRVHTKTGSFHCFMGTQSSQEGDGQMLKKVYQMLSITGRASWVARLRGPSCNHAPQR